MRKVAEPKLLRPQQVMEWFWTARDSKGLPFALEEEDESARAQPSRLRSYSRFATDNQTGGMPQIMQAGGGSPAHGRGVPPNTVESVINSSPGIVQPNGNVSHTSGSVEVILSPQGRVVTIETH